MSLTSLDEAKKNICFGFLHLKPMTFRILCDKIMYTVLYGFFFKTQTTYFYTFQFSKKYWRKLHSCCFVCNDRKSDQKESRRTSPTKIIIYQEIFSDIFMTGFLAKCTSGRPKRVKYRNTEYRSFGVLTEPNNTKPNLIVDENQGFPLFDNIYVSYRTKPNNTKPKLWYSVNTVWSSTAYIIL